MDNGNLKEAGKLVVTPLEEARLIMAKVKPLLSTLHSLVTWNLGYVSSSCVLLARTQPHYTPTTNTIFVHDDRLVPSLAPNPFALRSPSLLSTPFPVVLLISPPSLPSRSPQPPPPCTSQVKAAKGPCGCFVGETKEALEERREEKFKDAIKLYDWDIAEILALSEEESQVQGGREK